MHVEHGAQHEASLLCTKYGIPIVKYENLKDKENGETPVELIRSRPEYSCRATAKDYLSQQDRQSEQQQQPCAEHRTDFSHGNELLRKPTSGILQAI